METQKVERRNQLRKPQSESRKSNTEEISIREIINAWVEAVRNKDVDGVMEHYSTDVMVFGIAPPLHYQGADVHRKSWEEMFALHEGDIDYEISNLEISAGDNVAYVHCLNRIGGNTKSAQAGDTWTRVTVCYRKANGKWQATHEHVSLPFDMESGKASRDLKP